MVVGIRLSAWAALLSLFAACLIGPASAAPIYTLANSNNGDGYVTLTAAGFELFGANNGASENYTTYTTTASSSETLSFTYTYKSFDCCGAEWDPAGYVINGAYTQVSPTTYDIGYVGSGTISFSVSAGDTYGFYVYSPDSVQGRGEIAIPALSAVPLPSSAPMLGAALMALGAVGYGMKRKANAAA